MKILKIYLVFLGGLIFSGQALASGVYAINYQVNMTIDTVDNTSGFGGINIGDNFSGMLGANLAGQNGNSVLVSAADDGIDFMFDFTTGNHNYHFSYDALRDYISNPDYGFAETTLNINAGGTGFTNFTVNQYGDADSFEFYLDTASNSWSAYDSNIDATVSGTLSVSQVPVPAAVWLFASGIMGLVRYRRKQV